MILEPAVMRRSSPAAMRLPVCRSGHRDALKLGVGHDCGPWITSIFAYMRKEVEACGVLVRFGVLEGGGRRIPTPRVPAVLRVMSDP